MVCCEIKSFCSQKELHEITFNYSTNNYCFKEKGKHGLVRRSALGINRYFLSLAFHAVISFVLLKARLFLYRMDSKFAAIPVISSIWRQRNIDWCSISGSYLCARWHFPSCQFILPYARVLENFAAIILANLRLGTFSQLTLHNFSIYRVFSLVCWKKCLQ